MKKEKKKPLSLVKNEIAQLTNSNLIFGGDNNTGGETRVTEIKMKCIKGSKERVPVIEDAIDND